MTAPRRSEFGYASEVVPGDVMAHQVMTNHWRDRHGRFQQRRSHAMTLASPTPWRQDRTEFLGPPVATRKARRALELRAKAGDAEAARCLWAVWRCRVYTEAEIRAWTTTRQAHADGTPCASS